MANNKRVKLVADLIEAASNHNCKIPDSAIKEILDDKNNKAVLGIGDYTNVSQPVSFAKKLLDKRLKAIKELY